MLTSVIPICSDTKFSSRKFPAPKGLGTLKVHQEPRGSQTNNSSKHTSQSSNSRWILRGACVASTHAHRHVCVNFSGLQPAFPPIRLEAWGGHNRDQHENFHTLPCMLYDTTTIFSHSPQGQPYIRRKHQIHPP